MAAPAPPRSAPAVASSPGSWYDGAQMSRIYRSLPPAGTRLGIAFSGGLDTRCAVAWLSRQGMKVHAYTADLAQPDEKDPSDDSAGRAAATAPTAARLVDCREALAREGVIAIQCGAFHLSTGGKKYFNTTPLGRAVTATAIIRAMREDGVNVFGDGSTHKGNDIQRFYRYGILDQPESQDLQAVARPGVRRCVRRPQGDERVPRRASACRTRCRPRRRTAPTRTCSAPRTRPRISSTSTRACTSSSRSWASRTGSTTRRSQPRRVTVEFERGLPVAVNGKRFDDADRRRARGQSRSAGVTASA